MIASRMYRVGRDKGEPDIVAVGDAKVAWSHNIFQQLVNELTGKRDKTPEVLESATVQLRSILKEMVDDRG